MPPRTTRWGSGPASCRSASRPANPLPIPAAERRCPPPCAPTAVPVPSSGLPGLAAQARAAELRRAGGWRRRPRQAIARRSVPHRSIPHLLRIPAVDEVTLRFAFPDDECALLRLAALDSSPSPRVPVLLAEAAGDLRAALSLADGAVVADPFHPTAELVELLLARASQLSARDGLDPARRRWPWTRPAQALRPSRPLS